MFLFTFPVSFCVSLFGVFYSVFIYDIQTYIVLSIDTVVGTSATSTDMTVVVMQKLGL